MYVHSVKLINFKSIGDYPEAEVILEPRITAVIGKNESGKSNVLDGLASIRFTAKNASAFSADSINRSCPAGTEIRYSIILKPTARDCVIGITEDTQIEISQNYYIAKGGLLFYYLEKVDVYFIELLAALDAVSTNPMQLKDQELINYRTYKTELQRKDYLNIPQRNMAIDFLSARIGRIPAEHKSSLEQALEHVKKAWSIMNSVLPVFFYRKGDKKLAASYKLEEVEKELNNKNANSNSLLHDFVKLIGVSIEDFILAVRSGSMPTQESVRRKINRLIDEKINREFHSFYETEEISLDLGFNSGVVSFVVRSNDGEALMLSERSNGLRWYLETFIDARANDISGCNVVYLFDEPGTSLHVNAQRELLGLFNHLADQGNQVVYTTHSPYMLNLEAEGVHRIRAVVKSTDGFTYIYKTAYDSRIAPESQQDTLAPIIAAIGMNLQDTYGPALNKINIVTEGMSDYIYLCTMANALCIDKNKYAIIPAVGASNCVKICAILHGWGCQYIALFDYDKAGVESGGEYLRKEMLFEYKKQYCYLADVDLSEIEKRSYISKPYLIEDMVTKEEIEKFCNETETPKDIGKPLIAKLISNAIEAGNYILSENCLNNFKLLFERIFSYVQNERD